MSNNVNVLADLTLDSTISFSKNYTSFPPNPAPRTLVVLEGIPYLYTELVDGSGFFTWQPIGIKQASYLHTQGIASTIWTVSHNFNSDNFAYFVYDDNHNLVMANIEMLDLNTARIILTQAMTGTGVFFSLQYLNSTTVAASAELVVGSLSIVDHLGDLTINGDAVILNSELATIAKTGSYNDLSNKPSAVSVFANDSGYQTSSDVSTAIQAVVGAAPDALNTLAEIATHLADDESAAAVLTTAVATKAPLASPALTGVPTAPTAAALDNSTQVATTAFVMANRSSGATGVAGVAGDIGLTGATGAAGVKGDAGVAGAAGVNGDAGVAGAKGDIGLTGATGSVSMNNPVFTGTVSGVTAGMVGLGSVNNTADADKPVSTAQATAIALKADQATTYTKVESDARIQAVVGAAPLALDTLVEIAAQLAADESAAAALVTTVSLKAPLASPALTGVPTAPTAVALDNSTQVATTAFVMANRSSGATGIQGITGATGIQGITGTTGITGIQGVTGSTGIQGVIGLTGATGTVNLNNPVFTGTVSVGSISATSAVQATVATVTQTSIDTWAIASYRSTKYVVQITQGSSYQVSEILVIQNGTVTFNTEFATVMTGSSLASFDTSITSGNVNLLVTMAAATSATINIQKVTMAI